MAKDPERGMFVDRQSSQAGPERKLAQVSKSARPAPGSTPPKAEGEDDLAGAPTQDSPARGYDEGAAAGITDLPPAVEKGQQEDLPPRGERKKNDHA